MSDRICLYDLAAAIQTIPDTITMPTKYASTFKSWTYSCLKKRFYLDLSN